MGDFASVSTGNDFSGREICGEEKFQNSGQVNKKFLEPLGVVALSNENVLPVIEEGSALMVVMYRSALRLWLRVYMRG